MAGAAKAHKRGVAGGQTGRPVFVRRDKAVNRAGLHNRGVRRSRLPVAAAGLVATVVLPAGCGSTVPSVRAVAGPAASGQGLTVPTAGATSAGPLPGTSAGSAQAPLPAATGGATAPSYAGAGTPPGSTPNPAAPGQIPAAAPGVTATTIYVGIGYSSQESQGNAAVGAADQSASYDPRNVTNAAFDYANKHGGFAGRKLQAIYYDYNLTDDQSAQDQSACAHYTQDNKVFAIVANADILRACAEKAGALGYGVNTATSVTYQRFPHYFDPAGIRFDRLGQVTVDGLARAHYFTGKLGLITWDDPNYRLTVKNGYLPALAAHHVELATEPVYIAVPQQVGALGDMSAAVSSAVSKFKALGIDHVIIQDGAAGVWKGDGLTLTFMNDAKSQHYYPRYGGNVNNNPGNSLNPSDQQDHMLAVTDSDLDRSNDEGWHVNQAREKCYRIQADAGYPVRSGNLNDEANAALSCDIAFFLQRVVNSLPVLSTDAFMRAVSGLGTSFRSASVYETNLFPRRRDGSDAVRVVEYLASCSCLRYKGPPYRVN